MSIEWHVCRACWIPIIKESPAIFALTIVIPPLRFAIGFVVKIRSLYEEVRFHFITWGALVDGYEILFKGCEVLNKIFCAVIDFFVICLDF